MKAEFHVQARAAGCEAVGVGGGRRCKAGEQGREPAGNGAHTPRLGHSLDCGGLIRIATTGMANVSINNLAT